MPRPPLLPLGHVARLGVLGVWLLVGAGTAACEVSERRLVVPPIGPELPDLRDAGIPLPDGAVPCSVDSDCADGIDCTTERCEGVGYCVSLNDNSRCSDGVFCNGEEICQHGVGCGPGDAPGCSDFDTCTVDACDEGLKRCTHLARDFDEDGEVDWHCFGGTDCDDLDFTRGGEVVEICGDGVDNDCDGSTDESLVCGRPEHDTCAEALDVSAGGSFAISLAGARHDYTLGCAVAPARDVAFRFEIDEPRDVTLRARGLLADGKQESAVLAVRGSCDDLASELECGAGFPGQVRIRALAAGEYFVVVTADPARRVVLDVVFDDASVAPSNMDCSAPIDLGSGGRVSGDLVDVSDATDISCGFAGAGDLFYTFSLSAEQDVEISAIAATGERMNFAVRSVCDDPASTLRCETDAPAQARLHQLPAGTYHLVLEGPRSREVDFELDLALFPPTPVPAGDECATAIPLPLDTQVAGSLVGMQDRVDMVCDCPSETPDEPCGLFLDEVVYVFDVAQPTDLRVTVDGGESVLDFAVQSSCGQNAGQLACQNAGFETRVRNVQPGRYYLIVESADQTVFALQVDQLELSEPLVVSGNDSCGSAQLIPADGGLFAGDTLAMTADYQGSCGGEARSNDAVFRLDLESQRRVRAELVGTFDTVLHVFANSAGPAGCEDYEDLAQGCDDAVGPSSSSLLDLELSAGSYYFIVDGFNTRNAGAYTLEVTVESP
jgi:hypothetical protein